MRCTAQASTWRRRTEFEARVLRGATAVGLDMASRTVHVRDGGDERPWTSTDSSSPAAPCCANGRAAACPTA